MDSQQKYVVSYGELLWDILPSGPVLGGAPANFCYRLQTLGIPSYLISRVGKDEYGTKALNLLKTSGIDTSYIQVDAASPTGTVDVVLSARGNPTYTINTGVAYDNIELTEQYLQLAQGASVICFGTLIQRAPISRNTLSEILKAAPTPVKLLDINLRKDCHTRETILSSLEAADILKLNNEEVAYLDELLSLEAPDFPTFTQKIIELYDLKACVVTRASKGVYARSSDGETVDCPGHKVAVADTIGAGDSFTAGFIKKFLAGSSLQDCCETGNRLGALVSSKSGGMCEVSLSELENFRSEGLNYYETAAIQNS